MDSGAGSQARPTAQRLGRCPIGVRRFESGPAQCEVGRSDTVGYTYVKMFDTPGYRNPSRDYSQQYEISEA